MTFTFRSAPPKRQATARIACRRLPGAEIRRPRPSTSPTASRSRLLPRRLPPEPPYGGFVHNAGHTYDSLAVMMDQAKAEVAMQVNYWSFTRLVNALVRPMMRARDGRIAVIGSVAALAGEPGQCRLCGFEGRPARLCAHARDRGGAHRRYRELCCAGLHRHRHAGALCRVTASAMEAQIPARRFARPDEIAAIVAFLMSPGASYLTGAVLPVDGGLSAAIGIHR